MSGTGESRHDFAGEERMFRVRLGEIRRIEAACGVGIGEVARRLAHASLLINAIGKDSRTELLAAGLQIHSADVREVIYQGLVGHDMAPGNATQLVRAEIDDQGLKGLLNNVGTALVVLIGANETPEGDAPGE